MNNNHLLQCTVRVLDPVPVIFMKCVFRDHHKDPGPKIINTFNFLNQWAECMGLHPADLLQIGVPVFRESSLAFYTCCLEYPLPFIDEGAEVCLGELPGGSYLVTLVEKSLTGITFDIRHQVIGFLQQEHIQCNPYLPVYEIYHQHHAEYCVPILN